MMREGFPCLAFNKLSQQQGSAQVAKHIRMRGVGSKCGGEFI